MPKTRKQQRKALYKNPVPKAKRGIYRTHGLEQYTKGIERKFYDKSDSTISTSNGWTLFEPVVDLEQGNTPSERVGQKIFIKSLDIKASCRTQCYDSTSSKMDNPNMKWYWRVFVDKQTNGAVPSQADYQAGTGGDLERDEGGLATFRPNMSNSQRFVTLKQGCFSTPNYFATTNSTVSNVGEMAYHHEFDGQGLAVDITNTSGEIEGFKSNNIYIAFQNNGRRGASHEVWCYSRLRYTD